MRGIKSFFQPTFKEHLPKYKQSVLLNAMYLYNDRNKIIKLTENKVTSPSMYAMMKNLME